MLDRYTTKLTLTEFFFCEIDLGNNSLISDSWQKCREFILLNINEYRSFEEEAELIILSKEFIMDYKDLE